MTTLTAGTRLLAKTPEIPGPRPVPILGWLGNALPVLRDPLLHLQWLHRTYGDVVALAAGHTAHVFAFGPEYNHQLLSNPADFYSVNTSDKASPFRLPPDSAAARVLAGVAGMNGPQHVAHRRFLMPAFHRKRVDGLLDTVVAQTEHRLATWRPGQTLDLKHEIIELTMDIAISALLGLDPREDGLRVRRLLETWTANGLSIRVGMFPFDIPGFPYYRFMRMSERVEAEYHAVIARKRAAGTAGADVLAMLVEARDEDGGRLTDVELLGDLNTLFTAGHETSASSLVWTLFLLTQHPQVTADLLDELECTLHGAAPTAEQVNTGLPLLDSVIKEGMRLMPAALWLVRTAREPFTLGPYALPAGTHIVVSAPVTHRLPDLYPEPNRFLPARWAHLDPSPYEYLPFGGGPRRCLGATFAMMELKVMLALILQRFRLTVPPGTRVDRSGTILSYPRGRLPVVLAAQDRRPSPAGVRGTIHDAVDLG